MSSEFENLKMGEKSKHGGLRPNSGRKPKLKAEAREIFYAKVDDRWPLIVEKMDELLEKGDKEMIKFIIEQRIGKAPQSLEVEGDGKQQIQVNLIRDDQDQTTIGTEKDGASDDKLG